MITVNGQEIPQDSIFNEMQYHPAENLEQAQFLASRALIIEEIMRQRGEVLGLNANCSNVEELCDLVIEADVDTPEASMDDCLRFYQQNEKKFETFPLLAIRHILIKSAPEDFEGRAEAREQAVCLIDMLKVNSDQFGILTRQYSACSSKEMDGQLGQISKGQTVPEFEEQVVRFNEGLVETPIETRYGYHVVWIDQKIAGKQMPFEMVQDNIKHYLDEKVKRKAIAQYIAQRITESDIVGIELDVDERQTMQ